MTCESACIRDEPKMYIATGGETIICFDVREA
jgi:hypothetical protein